jgi:S1-C subfamily serine protease
MPQNPLDPSQDLSTQAFKTNFVGNSEETLQTASDIVVAPTNDTVQDQLNNDYQLAPTPPVQKVRSHSLSVKWWMIIFILISIIFYGLFMVAGIYIGSQYLGSTSAQETQIVRTEINNIKTVDENSAVIETVQATTDGVVSISVSRNVNTVQGGSRDIRLGAGTGFIISSTGYIITNRHVVNQQDVEYSVVFNNGDMVPAVVLDTDRYLDIAVLKIDVKEPLKPLNLGDSDTLAPGQTVIAIGNSLGEFNNSISKGVVSGLGRTITASDPSGDNVETLDDIIQTDASINPGNSGGPLLDIAGNVIGVNVARAQGGENVGFAIPINNVKLIVESVLENGKILRPYLGIRYISITPELARTNDLSANSGVLISGDSQANAVVKNSPADKAGLADGDIILSIDGKEINTDNKLPTLLLKYRSGDKVKLKVLRETKEVEIEITLENFPD